MGNYDLIDFPDGLDSFNRRQPYVELVKADDVNELQQSIEMLERRVGTKTDTVSGTYSDLSIEYRLSLIADPYGNLNPQTYTYMGSGNLISGDILALDNVTPSGVIKNTITDNPFIVGVARDGTVGGPGIQIPVITQNLARVNCVTGATPIAIGDFITASSTAGKATRGDISSKGIFGASFQALPAYSSGTILVYLQSRSANMDAGTTSTSFKIDEEGVAPVRLQATSGDLEVKNGAGTLYTDVICNSITALGNNDIYANARNDTGLTIPQFVGVKATGRYATDDIPTVDRLSSITDQIYGLTYVAIPDATSARIKKFGILQTNLNTSSSTIGASVYVDVLGSLSLVPTATPVGIVLTTEVNGYILLNLMGGGGSGGGGSDDEFIVSQVNTFVPGNAIYFDGTWKLANSGNAETLGTHIVKNASATTFTAVHDGKAFLPAHGFGTPGDYLYVSSFTDGAVTTTPAVSAFVNPIGQILDADNIIVYEWRASAPNNSLTQTLITDTVVTEQNIIDVVNIATQAAKLSKSASICTIPNSISEPMTEATEDRVQTLDTSIDTDVCILSISASGSYSGYIVNRTYTKGLSGENTLDISQEQITSTVFEAASGSDTTHTQLISDTDRSSEFGNSPIAWLVEQRRTDLGGGEYTEWKTSGTQYRVTVTDCTSGMLLTHDAIPTTIPTFNTTMKWMCFYEHSKAAYSITAPDTVESYTTITPTKVHIIEGSGRGTNFSDNFNRSDGTLGNGWSAVGEAGQAPGIISNQCAISGAQNENFRSRFTRNQENYELTGTNNIELYAETMFYPYFSGGSNVNGTSSVGIGCNGGTADTSGIHVQSYATYTGGNSARLLIDGTPVYDTGFIYGNNLMISHRLLVDRMTYKYKHWLTSSSEPATWSYVGTLTQTYPGQYLYGYMLCNSGGTGSVGVTYADNIIVTKNNSTEYLYYSVPNLIALDGDKFALRSTLARSDLTNQNPELLAVNSAFYVPSSVSFNVQNTTATLAPYLTANSYLETDELGVIQSVGTANMLLRNQVFN